MSVDPCVLPSELWRIIIRHATTPSQFVCENREDYFSYQELSSQKPHCLKDDAPLTPVPYLRRENSHRPPGDEFTQLETKCAISRVSHVFNELVTEFLFERIFISDPRSAQRMADTLESSSVCKNPGRWTRHITIIGVFFAHPSMSTELAMAALRILQHMPQLHSFHLSWNSPSRECREREEQIIDAVQSLCLRRVEWSCTGGGFERQQDHAFYRLLRRSSPTLQVLKMSGYLPLAETMAPSRPSESSEKLECEGISLPQLSHLKLRRAFRDDLLFLSHWDISARLTCLNLDSIWSYFDQREVSFAFWDTPKPMLRCLHFGEGSTICAPLAHKILEKSPGLRTLEYFFLGDWPEGTWKGVRHLALETVKVHVSHPLITLRSLFNSRRFSRSHQLDKILQHVGPFLGQMEAEEGANLKETATAYPAMRILEFSYKGEDLRYKPEELVDWLRLTIAESNIATDVELSVEMSDYIR